MRYLKIHIITALVLFTSCLKEVGAGDDMAQKRIVLNVALGSYGGDTRGIEHATEDSDAVALDLSNANVYTYDEVGAGGIETEKVTPVEFTLSDDASTEDITEYTAQTFVLASTKQVKIEFNSDGGIYDGTELTNNVNSRQGSVEEPVVLVSGLSEEISSDNTVRVEAKPEMARVQIVDDILVTTDDPNYTSDYIESKNYRNLTIEGIYINRTRLVRDGVKDITEDDVTLWDADFSATGSKKGLYVDLSCPITNESGVVNFGSLTSESLENINFFSRTTATNDKPKSVIYNPVSDTYTQNSGESVGFNIFPQGAATSTFDEARNEQAHIILKISYSQRQIGEVWYPTESGGKIYSYINFIAFSQSAMNYPAFEAGKVYELSMRDLLDATLTEATPTPDPDPDNLSPIILQVKVRNWELENYQLEEVE